MVIGVVDQAGNDRRLINLENYLCVGRFKIGEENQFITQRVHFNSHFLKKTNKYNLLQLNGSFLHLFH